MEFHQLTQLIETNAKAILGCDRRLNRLSAHSIIEGSDRLELLQRLNNLEQEVKLLKGNSHGWSNL